jgi:hypothetical protein
MEPIVFKKRPVTKTTKTYTQRFDVDVEDEDKPKVEKKFSAEDTEWMAKTTITAYKAKRLNPRWAGAFWYKAFDRIVKVARALGYPVDEWLVPRKKKELKNTP